MKYAISPKPVLGPCACQDCGEPLWWARRNTTVLHVVVGSLRWRDSTGHIHACRGRQRRYNGRLKGGRYPQIRHETIHHGLAPSGKMDRDEYSVSIGYPAQRPVSRLYSERQGACVAEYRRNAT